MLFRLNLSAGQPLYIQIVEQIRHAAETGVLQDGEQLPGIRTLAEELVVSPNTVIKAYAELEKTGLLVMRHGAGAFIALKRRTKQGTTRMQAARRRVGDLIEQLREDGLADEESRRAFEAGPPRDAGIAW